MENGILFYYSDFVAAHTDCDLVHNKAAIIAYKVRGILSLLLSGLV